ncbi:MAG: FAD-dependent oxidoreductase [Bacteroidia bacterium]
MKKPIIFTIDDDEEVLRAITRDLRTKYRQHYRVLSTSNPQEALDSLPELKKKTESVALFLVDQRMPEMLGVDFIVQAREFYPEAKRVLLTAYSDTEAAIRAINDVRLDYYLMKPWDPPEQKLYPVLDDLLEDWRMNFRPPYQGLKVLGYQYSPASHAIKDFLSGNLFPYKWLDAEAGEEASEMMNMYELQPKDLPAIIFEDGKGSLCNPALEVLAERLGLSGKPQQEVYDVVIIGAGPSGLAAAVYGGSEGLKTLLVEKYAPGGQAGTSSRIENYLGFPSGLSGADLTRRALSQARRFGTEFLAPRQVVSIRSERNYKIIGMKDGSTINSRSVIISTGVEYIRLEAKGIEQFTGAGVYYGAAMTEANSCRDKDVYIIGGGNSAGQAAMHIANYASQVFIIIRGENLSASMSQYLIDQIDNTQNVSIINRTQVEEAIGNGRLEKLRLKNLDTGKTHEAGLGALFVFIGAKPYTEWISLELYKDDKGFIETGRDLMRREGFKKIWKLNREPFFLETCSPGIFASGDVRSGAMNRVASAVGEGAMAIKFVHQYLAEN